MKFLLSRTRFCALLLLPLLLLLPGCWWPEEFTATLELNADHTYHFTYDGVLAFGLAAAEVHRTGRLDPQTENDLKRAERDLLKEPGFKRADYLGNGRYRVRYESTGGINRRIELFSPQLKILTLEPSGEGVLVRGMDLSADDKRKAREIGLRLDGEIRIVSALESIRHNAETAPALGLGSHQWHLTFDSEAPPVFQSSGAVVTKPLLPGVTGGSRVLLIFGVSIFGLISLFMVFGLAVVLVTRLRKKKA